MLAARRRRPIMGWSGPCFCPTNDGCCESAVLRALDVAFGSKPENLKASICFPLFPSKQTSPASRRKQKDYLAVILPDAWGEPCLFLSLAKEKDHGRSRKYHGCQQKARRVLVRGSSWFRARHDNASIRASRF